ncbi:tyrosine-type recombinase/integrase [Rickettsiella endosymbiont of Dermanyssus gallinae]|uniref:tyrosine-type recombinase/integrase n=1 Tax=Rickettsiella endosymbiont of Dermanyssus gallinae TaxID=2856608 RepID=UPI001FE9980F|nr:tyrosine-type recombinase/integrase [Rickettsiella endosymbiont of Dermanyssus gallinae]
MHDRLKADLWRRSKLKEKPQRLWQEAVIRWLNEATYKRSLDTDKFHLDWVCPYLKDKKLSEIDGDLLEDIAREKEKEGVAPATVNRLLAVLRAILKKAEEKWKWIEKAPFVEMRRLGERRERWLTREEAQRLLQVLPSHLADLATFSLATGLRKKNVTGLCWQDIDLVKRHAFVRAAQSMRQESIVKAMRSRRARDRRALTGEAGNASRRKVICGRHGHELRRSECVPDAGRIAA